jgi:hypothetical protein
MEIDFALLADFAKISGGKMDIQGGGFENVNARKFPYAHPIMFIVLRMKVHAEELEEEHNIEIRMIDPDGKNIVPPMILNINIESDIELTSYKIPLIGNYMNLLFPEPGNYRFDIFVDGNHEKSIPLNLMKVK